MAKLRAFPRASSRRRRARAGAASLDGASLGAACAFALAVFVAPSHSSGLVTSRADLERSPASGGAVTAKSGFQGTPDALGTPASRLEPDVRAALERGLAFLAQAQSRTQDGSLPRLEGAQDVTVAVTALGALALMAGGSTPERGAHSREIARAVDFLLARADMSASPTHGYISNGASEPTARMHGHGFAALALAQAYTMSPSGARGERLARTLEAAVQRIEASQSVEGGWFYSPTANIEHENSVTVVQLQALRAAHNCGVKVDSRVVSAAVDYIRRCQSEDGAFRYALDPTQKTSIALTAAGLATLHSAGVYEGPEVQRATDALWRKLTARAEGQERAADFPYYERLYVAIALWTMPDQRGFVRWFDEMAASAVGDQRADGAWSDERYGACYATAMNCLVLSMPDGLLPLFER
jgi:hypothetical protein